MKEGVKTMKSSRDKNFLTKRVIGFSVVGLGLSSLFMNCSSPYSLVAVPQAASSIQTSQFTITQGKVNPPLDLFFIIDNSASMKANQVNLSQSFQNIFTSNQGNLSQFNTTVYVYSTASTLNPGNEMNVPTRAPSSISFIPTDTVANLASVPGNIFGIYDNLTGIYGTAPFSAYFNPAAVLDMDADAGHVINSFQIPSAATSTNYNSAVTSATQKFTNRLGYLNPTNQYAYGYETNISSGLCSMSRILRHAHDQNLIGSGDAAAFIMVSDDDDRLNVRNDSGNQCTESVLGGSSYVDGTCGHYEQDYNYNTTATLTYQTGTQFTYESGTRINYSYPSSENCVINYQDGYKFTSTYDLVQTQVSYSSCTQLADGFCLSQANVSILLAGNYASGGGVCNQNMTSLVSNPMSGTAFTCTAANQAGLTGPSGVDANTSGQSCSQATANSLAGLNKINVSCTLGSLDIYQGKTVYGQAVGTCTNFCSGNSVTYKSCVLTNTNVNSTSATLALGTNGITSCNSSCPSSDSAVCGNSTISNYISSLHVNAVCNPTAPTSPATSVLTLSQASDVNENFYACNTSISGLSIAQGNAAVCAGASNMNACIQSLQHGANTLPLCQLNSPSSQPTATYSAGVLVDVGCNTSCANSSGLCSSTPYATVKDFIHGTKNNGVCLSSANGGLKTYTLKFQPAFAKSSTCSALCSSTVTGSCDGAGWGAGGGSTVAQYISHIGGDTTCNSPSTRYVSDTPKFIVDSASSYTDASQGSGAGTSNACVSFPQSPSFALTNSAPYFLASATNYVAGDSTHKAADFQNFVVSQSQQVLGANNPLSLSLIVHTASDNLPSGTDISTQYINLAGALGSTQISGVTSNYNSALAGTSNYIIASTLYQYVLPVSSDKKVISVSVMRKNTATWVLLTSGQWSWSGQTLSLGQSLALNIGDQVSYKFESN